MSQKLSAAEARKEYWLTTDDLIELPFESFSFGFATGRPLHFYDRGDLEQVAVRKHGADVLESKRQKRVKRQANKLKKEEEDFKKFQQQQQQQQDSAESKIKPESSKENLSLLRQDIKKAFQPFLNDTHYNPRGLKNGEAKITLPRVTESDFIALIGDDSSNLEGKKGAWIVANVPFQTVFDQNTGLFGSEEHFWSDGPNGIDPKSTLEVKYNPSKCTLSVAAFIDHERFFNKE